MNDESGYSLPEQMKREFRRSMVRYTCTFCGREQPGGYCFRCQEWFLNDQDAIADAKDAMDRWP